MGCDERAIREVHATWIDAVNGGDLVRLLALMANDVVFLNPGQAPFGRDGFPVGFSAAHQQSRIHCISELEEGVMVGEVAYTLCRESLICNTARRRRSNGVGRTSDHHIPQAVRRPLASGPRRQNAVPASKLRD
jgi:ketosteroid isomerase-like protein